MAKSIIQHSDQDYYFDPDSFNHLWTFNLNVETLKLELESKCFTLGPSDEIYYFTADHLFFCIFLLQEFSVQLPCLRTPYNVSSMNEISIVNTFILYLTWYV